MFIIVDDERKMLAVSRGDSASFCIKFIRDTPDEDEKGVITVRCEDIPDDGTNALFTVKNDHDGEPRGSAMIIKYATVSDSAVQIDLLSQDTNKLDQHNYLWDLRILYSDTKVRTPIKPSRFTVMDTVGDV